jgi:uncharacterized membrane protein
MARPATDTAPCAEPGETTPEERQRVVEALRRIRQAGGKVTLRELHRLAALPQPVVLRCVRHLERAGAVRVEQMEHDPLAGEVVLL